MSNTQHISFRRGIKTEATAHDAEPPVTHAEAVLLAAILLIAFALRLALPIFLPSIHHPDELYQYLEQGHRLAFGYGVIPWEYREGTRSWLLPGLLGSVMWVTAWFGGDVPAYMTVVGCTLSALSLSIVIVAWRFARRLAGPAAAILTAGITATWFELVYFGPRPLTEAIAASTLFWAAYLFCGAPRRSLGTAVAAGILLGLTFVLRFHLAPAIFAVAAIGFFRFPVGRWLVGGLCGTAVLLAAGMLDWATWGYPFHSFWRYFYLYGIENKSAQWGVLPWYGFAKYYVLFWSGFTVPFAVLVLIGARRAPYLLVIPLIIVISHTFIGHKEYRYVLPALPFFLLLAAIGTADIVAAARSVLAPLPHGGAIAAAMLSWALVSATLMVGNRIRAHVTESAPLIAAVSALRDVDAVCGIGLVDVPWYWSGVYTYLHRNVPLYLVDEAANIDAASAMFNAALAIPSMPMERAGFRRNACYGNNRVCLYIRDGACRPRPKRSINQTLIDRGE